MQDLYQTTQDYHKEQGHLAKWDLMPKSLSSFGVGGRAGPLMPLSSPLPRRALGSEKLPHPSIPSCHTAILALSPRAPPLLPLFFLIQTHHQFPLPMAELLMAASP